MASASTSDLLGGAALALAGLSIFYSLWAPEIEAASKIQGRDHRADRGPQIRAVQGTRRTRAIPLAFAASLVAALLAPPVIAILAPSISHLLNNPGRALADYNAVEALLVATWLGLVGLAWLSCSAVIALSRKVNQLEVPDATPLRAAAG